MVTFIISYTEKDQFRRVNLDYLTKYLSALALPGKEIIVVEQDTEEKYVPKSNIVKKIFLQNDGIFNKGWGYNVGAKEATNDILFFNDCDIVMPKHNYPDAIKKIGAFDVVDPYKKIYYYNERHSRIVIDLNDARFHPNSEKTCPSGVISGGAFVIKRSVFMCMKGFDEDCAGWGHEDDIFDAKIRKLGFKIHWNTANHCYHLFHPVADKGYYTNKESNRQLHLVYLKMTEMQLKEKILTTKSFGERIKL